MKYIQVGEIGKAVLVPSKDYLPTASKVFLDKVYLAADTNSLYTCKISGSGYAWFVINNLPILANGIDNPLQLQEGKEAINALGAKVVGTMKFAEKTIAANGTYVPTDDGVQAYSKVTVNVAGTTTENPYIATTEAEMQAYLSEEYVGSFVRYENAKNRPGPGSGKYFEGACAGMYPGDGRADFFNFVYIGQSRMNRYIDYWIDSLEGTRTILKYSDNRKTPDGTIVNKTTEIYAIKSRNSDGTYTRKLLANFTCKGKADITAMPIYVDNGTNEEMVYVNKFGWYLKGDKPSDNATYLEIYDAMLAGTFTGVKAASYFTSYYIDEPYADIVYKNSVVICRYNEYTLDEETHTGTLNGELESNYQDLGVYQICKIPLTPTFYTAKLVFNGALLENPWGNSPDLPESPGSKAADYLATWKGNAGVVFRYVNVVSREVTTSNKTSTLIPGRTYIIMEE